MFELPNIAKENKIELYNTLGKYTIGLFHGEDNMVTNMAQFTSLLFYSLPDVSWVGFYLFEPEATDLLVLAPFQGKPACTRIPIGKGVCGTAAEKCEVLVVDDVSTFDGHIACDDDTKSEIVIPIMSKNKLYGVLDIDSAILNRFDEKDVKGLQFLVDMFVQHHF